MNKHDIFCDRINKRSVRNDEKNWFTDYEGGCSEQEAFDYIKYKFLSVCKDKSRKVWRPPALGLLEFSSKWKFLLMLMLLFLWQIVVKRTRAINTRVVEHTMEELYDALWSSFWGILLPKNDPVCWRLFQYSLQLQTSNNNKCQPVQSMLNSSRFVVDCNCQFNKVIISRISLIVNVEDLSIEYTIWIIFELWEHIRICCLYISMHKGLPHMGYT